MSEKRQVRTMQVLVIFFIAVSVFIALDPPTFIAQLMGISWGRAGRSFSGAVSLRAVLEGDDQAGVWASFIVGVGITVVNMFMPFIESSINAGAAAMVAGLIVVPVVSLITPKLSREKTDAIFLLL